MPLRRIDLLPEPRHSRELFICIHLSLLQQSKVGKEIKG